MMLLLYKLLELASTGFYLIMIDKFFEAYFPEYRLHKRILSLSSDTSLHPSSQSSTSIWNKCILSLSHNHSIGGTNGFRLIRDSILSNPHRRPRLRHLGLTRDCGIFDSDSDSDDPQNYTHYTNATILAQGLSSPHNTHLQSLDLSSNRNSRPPRDVDPSAGPVVIILRSLSSPNPPSRTLQHLRLDGNAISSTAAISSLAHLLRSPNAILSLDLHDNKITDDGASILAETLASPSSRLVHLDLGRNRIGQSGIGALCRKTLPNNTSLRHLGLGSSNADDVACGYIATALASGNTALRSLDLNRGAITTRGAQTIAKALRSGSGCRLEELNLSCNRSMVEDGTVSILEALHEQSFPPSSSSSSQTSSSSSSSLRILRMDGNYIRTQREKLALKTAIQSSSITNLIQLDLRSCFIFDDATLCIAEGLKSPGCRLESLNLQGNRIGGARAGGGGGGDGDGCVVAHLASALGMNTSLRMLNLSFNDLGVEGVRRIGEGLYGNRTLRMLNVAFNFDCDCDDSGAGASGDAVLRSMRRALFFPPLLADNPNNDYHTEGTNNTSIHPTHMPRQRDDVADLQVGWSPNRDDVESHYPTLDINGSRVYSTTDGQRRGRRTSCRRCFCNGYRTRSVYGWTVYAKRRGKEEGEEETEEHGCCFPLQRAARSHMKWRDGMEKLLGANYLVLEETDPRTGLVPFMAAAVGDGSDWEAVYRLLQENPGGLVGYVSGGGGGIGACV